MIENFLPLDGKVFPRFSGIKTFFRLPELRGPEDFQKADIALMGIPFDGGTSYRPGARFAPEAIRGISSLGRGYHPEHEIHIFKTLNIGDAGDVPVKPQDIAATHAQIRQSVAALLASDCMPIMIGGDHSTSIGSIQAVVDKYGPIGMVHFDAHTDAYPPAWDCDIHHGTFMRHGHERGWFRKNGVIQIGIRGPFSSEEDIQVPHHYGYDVLTVAELHRIGIATAQERIRAVGGGPVYVSFDVDCLDPAFAPGTGTPVPGGLTSFEALQLMQALAGLDVVAADVVEVSPPYDHANITSLVATSALWAIMAAKAKRADLK